MEIVNVERKEKEEMTTTTTNWSKIEKRKRKETTTETAAIIKVEVQVTESVFGNNKHYIKKKGRSHNRKDSVKKKKE